MKELIEDTIFDLYIPKNLGSNRIPKFKTEPSVFNKTIEAEAGIKVPDAIPEVSIPAGSTNQGSEKEMEMVCWVIGGVIVVGILYVGYQYLKEKEEKESKYKIL